MELKVSPVIVATEAGTNKTKLLKKIKAKKREMRDLKVSPVVITTDLGKETVEYLSMPGNAIFLDLNRILGILETDMDTLIYYTGYGAIVMYNEKLYINSCNLLRIYNNLNTDREFFSSMLALSTRTGKEKSCDKLQLACELLDSAKKIKSALNSQSDRRAKYKMHEAQRQDYLHDVENDFEDEEFIKNIKMTSYKRRKAKNDLAAIEVIDEHIKESDINKIIAKLGKIIEINKKKIYTKRAKKSMEEKTIEV